MKNTEIPLRLKQFMKKRDDYQLGPIDLEIQPGLVYAVVGRNGAGKSTLLKGIMNLAKPNSGHVEIFGNRYLNNEDDIKSSIAYVPEPLEGCENFTLEQLGQLIGQWYPEWDDTYFLACARDFSIPLTKTYSRLSQGDRKKVAITLALSTRAQLMLLDEPTNGLDATSRRHFRRLLLEDETIIERTVLLATHSVDDIRQYADYILILKNGKLEGPYEKDILINSWKRLWLNEEQAPLSLNIPGVVESGQSPFPHLVSNNLQGTLAYLEEHHIVVTKEQAIPLEEIIESMLAESKIGEVNL